MGGGCLWVPAVQLRRVHALTLPAATGTVSEKVHAQVPGSICALCSLAPHAEGEWTQCTQCPAAMQHQQQPQQAQLLLTDQPPTCGDTLALMWPYRPNAGSGGPG
jgi:hypothetical protein